MAETSTTGRVREATHAGSWYTADGTALADELGAAPYAERGLS